MMETEVANDSEAKPQVAGERSYLPATVDPSLSLDSEAEAGRDAAGRLGDLYARMRPCRQRLDAILRLCREPRTMEEIEEDAGPGRQGARGVYGTSDLCRLLVRAGGLEERVPEAAEPQVVEVDGASYLDPSQAEAEPPRYATTPAGLERLEDALSPAPFLEMLGEEPRYEHVYRILLDACANDGGATARQLGDAVDDDPELQEPRLYASYFYDRLDRAGMIEWNGSWCVTEAGRSAIAWLDGQA